MKKYGYVTISAILSLLLHLLILGVADKIRLADITVFPAEAPPRPIRLAHQTDVRDVQANVPQNTLRQQQQQAESRKQADQLSEKMKQVFREAKLDFDAKPRVRLEGLGRPVLAPPLPAPEQARPATAPRPKIIEVDAAQLSPERYALERRFSRKLERTYIPEPHVPSLLTPGALQGAVGATYGVGMRMGGGPGAVGMRVGDLPPDGGLGGGPLAGRNEYTPAAGMPGFGNLGGDLADVNLRPKAGQGEGDFRALDPYVIVNVTIYEDRGGGGYFRADIAANPRSEELWDVPKDILFVIDHSTSIASQKLAQFKESTVEALEYLNPKDRFNIVSFTTTARTPFPEFVPCTRENIEQAKGYVRGLTRGGMTDIFGGISPFIRRSNGAGVQAGRPLNFFLMTDGVQTVNIFDDSDFIRGIKGLNPGNVSVYSFSADRRANRNLLEFLSYHNRGYSMHVEDLKDFRSMLVDYMSTHSQLILSDVSYHLADGMADEAFPKMLPHLYRTQTLSFYGRFAPGTELVNIRVSGRGGDGEPYELVFWKRLDECLRGEPDLAQQWAAQKVFHLVGQRVVSNSPEEKGKIADEIRELARKFDLYVPY
ncbi:MAG: VWA domain-containing protein [Lentisphaeria bacterium]|jgi:hypothetical protein|nr:VWA domain-containing protein [Lentisphaeria bacterium]